MNRGIWLLLLLCSGCGETVRQVAPQIKLFDNPPLNQISAVELGDTVLSKGKTYTYDAIVLAAPVSSGDGVILKKLTVNAGTLLKKEESDNRDFYYSDNFTVFDAMIGVLQEPGGIAIYRKRPGAALFMGGTHAAHAIKVPAYTKTSVTAKEQLSFRQELIYNGRVGSSVKFLYREISNDMMRGSFSQEVQYDLSMDRTFGFKGVRIEVIDASNTQLRYRVLNSFANQ